MIQAAILSKVQRILSLVSGLNTGDLARILQISIDNTGVFGSGLNDPAPIVTGTLPSGYVEYSSWTIPAGQTITAFGSPQIIKVSGTLTIEGTLQAVSNLTGAGRAFVNFNDAANIRSLGGLSVSGNNPGKGGRVTGFGNMASILPTDALFGAYFEGGQGGAGVGSSGPSSEGSLGVGSGGSGGSNSVAGTGGTGGAGGGALLIIAQTLNIGAAGKILSVGSDGSFGSVAGAGGGGGGSIILLYNNLTITPGGEVKSAGGTGGILAGAGGVGGSNTTLNGPVVAGGDGTGISGGGGSSGIIIARQLN